MYDIPPVVWHLRRHHPLFVAKTELSRGVPFVSYVLRHSGAALIDRGNSRQALKAIADMARLVHREKRSEEHTSELQSLMRNSSAVFCLKKKKQNSQNRPH